MSDYDEYTACLHDEHAADGMPRPARGRPFGKTARRATSYEPVDIMKALRDLAFATDSEKWANYHKGIGIDEATEVVSKWRDALVAELERLSLACANRPGDDISRAYRRAARLVKGER